MATSEQQLAFAIITDSYLELKRSNYTSKEEIDFLLGRTPRSRFWFEVAGIAPLKHEAMIMFMSGRPSVVGGAL